ncbi:MAG: phosphoribosylformylglycinamidine synthase I [Deltaproteobacteria bacterium]|nr:phosphoribosylformylglycinamidine synthase I [Deltaproteobacteria bacterium]
MKSSVKALVLSGFGLNCDNETVYAFELAGATAVRVHINELISGNVSPTDFQVMVFIGGFSWGDDHGAGVIQAVRLKNNIGDKILEFIEKGNLVLGICNGFQTLVNLGLLPGFDDDYKTRSVALTFNDCGNFRDQWVNLKANRSAPCIFTKDLDNLELPVRHGEGKFYTDDLTLSRLKDNNQVVLQYTTNDGVPANGSFPDNPNGSIFDIAGICDPTGRVFGLMPHPEAFHHPSSHPDWTRQKEVAKRNNKDWMQSATSGLVFFQNAVNYF